MSRDTGMKVHNPLKSAEIRSWHKFGRTAQDKQDSKIVYAINESWYFNKANTFSSFEEESIEFNGVIINMMLPTTFL